MYKIRSSDKFGQFLEFNEAVVETDVFGNAKLFGHAFQADPIAFALLANQTGVRRAQHQIDEVWELRDDLWDRLQDILDPFARSQQAEGQRNGFPIDVELLLQNVLICVGNVGNSMDNHINLITVNCVGVEQGLSATLRHHNQPRGHSDQLHHDRALRLTWLR